MAGVAALFASHALPFPSTSAASCSCRFRPAAACEPRHPPGRRVLRRFDEVEGVSKKRRDIGGGGGGSQAPSSRRDRGLTVDFKETQGGKNKKPAMPSVESSPVEEKKPKKELTAMKKRKREREKRKPKSKFQEYLEMEMGGAVSREEDLETEKTLAKMLKLKKGKLGVKSFA